MKKNTLVITGDLGNNGIGVFTSTLFNELSRKKSLKVNYLLSNDKGTSRKNCLLISLKNLSKVIILIKQSDLVYINVQNYKTILTVFLAILYKKKIINHYHNFFYNRSYSLAKQAILFLKKLIIINLFSIFSSKQLFITNAQMLNFKKLTIFKRSMDNKSLIVKNFLSPNLSKYDSEVSQKIRKQEDAKNRRINILFIGDKKSRVKGDDFAWQIAKQNPNLSFTFIDASEQEKLDNVLVRPRLNDIEISKEYLKADALMSLSAVEVSPLSFLEAMFFGCAVFAFHFDGIDEIISNEKNGHIFKYGDVQKLNDFFGKLELINFTEISKKNHFESRKYLLSKVAPVFLQILNKTNNGS